MRVSSTLCKLNVERLIAWRITAVAFCWASASSRSRVSLAICASTPPLLSAALGSRHAGDPPRVFVGVLPILPRRVTCPSATLKRQLHKRRQHLEEFTNTGQCRLWVPNNHLNMFYLSIVGIPDRWHRLCCARAASGRLAAPPISIMNSRRGDFHQPASFASVWRRRQYLKADLG